MKHQLLEQTVREAEYIKPFRENTFLFWLLLSLQLTITGYVFIPFYDLVLSDVIFSTDFQPILNSIVLNFYFLI
jgi:hypothetical protein